MVCNGVQMHLMANTTGAFPLGDSGTVLQYFLSIYRASIYCVSQFTNTIHIFISQNFSYI